MWPALAVTALIGSTALNAYADYSKGKQAKELAERNAQIAEEDARLAEENALGASRSKLEEVRRLISTQGSMYSKAGVKLDRGTPSDVMGDSWDQGQQDAMAILAQGMASAKRLRAQAGNYRFEGEAAYKGGVLSALGDIAKGVAQYPVLTGQVPSNVTKMKGIG